MGREVIEKEKLDLCPLCRQPIDRDNLLFQIAERMKTLQALSARAGKVRRIVALLVDKLDEAKKRAVEILLPDDIEPFGTARNLMWQKHISFLQQGGDQLSEIRTINDKLKGIRAAMVDDFPLSQSEVEAHRDQMAEHLMLIHDIEKDAVQMLQAAVS